MRALQSYPHPHIWGRVGCFTHDVADMLVVVKERMLNTFSHAPNETQDFEIQR